MALAHNAANAAAKLASLPFYRQLGMMLGLAASVAIGVAVVLWSRDPNYMPVYTQVSHRDAADMMDVLQRNGIRFKFDQNQGLILVPSEAVQQSRLKLAQEGLPRENHGASFDFLSNTNAFNNSQFMENARYKLALEQELAKTISQFHDIKSARVHLAIPRESAFVRDHREPSASIFIDVYSNHDMPKRTIASIVNLVASSVPSLKASRVTVVDQNGQLFSEGAGNHLFGETERLLDYRQTIEQQYTRKIQDILTPLLGFGRAQARVSVDMDFTSHEQTQESFNPKKGVVRSEQLMEENRSSKEDAEGVPGALSNKPPAMAQAVPGRPAENVQGPNQQQEAELTDYRKQSTRNYEVDKTISHTRNQPGTIRRLSVAVLVDNKPVYDEASKKMEIKPLTEEELEQIKLLVSDAIGLDAKRGDSLNVINSHFVKPDPIDPMTEEKFWQKEGFWSIVKQSMAAGFILLLVFGLFKPLLRNLASDKEKEDAKALPDATGDNSELLPAPTDYEGQIALLRQVVNKEPKRVAQVVKNWVEKG
ncbi:MAG: flagellar M-ring protein FliF [Legionellaceae bacterium]|nr:flagellar M-ring protein FliF [Legionellaceae bacterium]